MLVRFYEWIEGWIGGRECVCVACKEARNEGRSFTCGSERSVCWRLDLLFFLFFPPFFSSCHFAVLLVWSVSVGNFMLACLLALRGAFCAVCKKRKEKTRPRGAGLLT